MLYSNESQDLVSLSTTFPIRLGSQMPLTSKFYFPSKPLLNRHRIIYMVKPSDNILPCPSTCMGYSYSCFSVLKRENNIGSCFSLNLAVIQE